MLRGESWGRLTHSHTNHTTTTITHRHLSQHAKPLSIKKSKPCIKPGKWTLCHITCSLTLRLTGKMNEGDAHQPWGSQKRSSYTCSI